MEPRRRARARNKMHMAVWFCSLHFSEVITSVMRDAVWNEKMKVKEKKDNDKYRLAMNWDIAWQSTPAAVEDISLRAL